MTEAEWLKSADIQRMLRYLETAGSYRKHRLFACASCRQYPKYLRSREAKETIQLAERFAEGESGVTLPERGFGTRSMLAVVEELLQEDAPTASTRVIMALLDREGEQVSKKLIVLLRDVFGNPFRPSPTLSPAVLDWNGGTVPRIAEGIYNDRAWGRLPILADALLDAGCDDEELIGHCRSEGPPRPGVLGD